MQFIVRSFSALSIWTKHIDNCLHVDRHMIESKEIVVDKVDSKENSEGDVSSNSLL